MIFSKKIYKIESGTNISMFAQDQNNLSIYLYSTNLKKYNISLSDEKKFIFVKSFNYSKVIKLNQTAFCPCLSSYISLAYDENI